MDLHGDALNKIVGDMDDMETKKMFPAGGSGGATITITVSPGGGEGEESGESGMDDLPPDHDIEMCRQIPRRKKSPPAQAHHFLARCDLGLAQPQRRCEIIVPMDGRNVWCSSFNRASVRSNCSWTIFGDGIVQFTSP